MTNFESIKNMNKRELAKILITEHIDYDYNVYYFETPDNVTFHYNDDRSSNGRFSSEKVAFENAIEHTEKWLDNEYCLTDSWLFTRFNHLD